MPEPSAALAAAQIQNDLKQLDRLKRETDRLRSAFVASYRRLWESRALREDARSVALLLRIGAARSADEMEACVRALAASVADLALRHGGRGPARPTAPKLRLVAAEDFVDNPPPRRTVLRL